MLRVKQKKTARAIDEGIKRYNDNNFLLKSYHEITELVLSLAMDYVDRKNTIRKHQKIGTERKVSKLINGTTEMNNQEKRAKLCMLEGYIKYYYWKTKYKKKQY